jgi:hypothetical protein
VPVDLGARRRGIDLDGNRTIGHSRTAQRQSNNDSRYEATHRNPLQFV